MIKKIITEKIMYKIIEKKYIYSVKTPSHR